MPRPGSPGQYLTLDCLGGLQLFPLPQDKRGGKALTAYLLHDLKEFVMATSLVDAPSSGSFYTWTNGSLWSKLDRVLMNSVSSDRRLMCSAEFLPMEPTSNHCPVLATVGAEIRGTAQYVLCGKLKLLKKPLRKLNCDEFRGIFDKTSRVKEAFKAAIILQMATLDDLVFQEEVRVLRERADVFMHAERTLSGQKARCTHLVEGDYSTKYFYAMVNKNKQMNSISYVVR
ncbi:hypothetical protein LIER_42597 [Lithospermum erythrorhizon]|uniref:Uncharacterized protein n=1 Tax=Lithospermum erythrorhizon TaxID=34254 RepID=A0AAV3NLL6_LITER